MRVLTSYSIIKDEPLIEIINEKEVNEETMWCELSC